MVWCGVVWCGVCFILFARGSRSLSWCQGGSSGPARGRTVQQQQQQQQEQQQRRDSGSGANSARRDQEVRKSARFVFRDSHLSPLRTYNICVRLLRACRPSTYIYNSLCCTSYTFPAYYLTYAIYYNIVLRSIYYPYILYSTYYTCCGRCCNRHFVSTSFPCVP